MSNSQKLSTPATAITSEEQERINYNAVKYINDLQQTILQQQKQLESAMAMASLDYNKRNFNNNNQLLQLELQLQQQERQENQSRAGLRAMAEEDQAVKGNALAESALARRRKRQSMIEGVALNLTPSSNPETNSNHFIRHRRTVSNQSSTSNPATSTSSSFSAFKVTTPPPSLILSKPGESYPISDEDQSHTKYSSSHSHSRTSSNATIDLLPSNFLNRSPPLYSTPSPPPPVPAKDDKRAGEIRGVQQVSRPSQMNKLSALDGRNKRFSSQGASLTNSNTSSKSNSPSPPQLTPRSISDSTILSPLANSFNPIPLSTTLPFNTNNDNSSNNNNINMNLYNPYLNQDLNTFNNNNYQYQTQLQQSNNTYQDYYPKPLQQQPYQPYYPTPNTTPIPSPYRQSVPVSGVATPYRKPRGPASESEFETANFATRLRKQAIAMLGGRMRSN